MVASGAKEYSILRTVAFLLKKHKTAIAKAEIIRQQYVESYNSKVNSHPTARLLVPDWHQYVPFRENLYYLKITMGQNTRDGTSRAALGS